MNLKDEEIVFAATKYDPYSFIYIVEFHSKNKELIRQCAYECGAVAKYIDDELANDREFILELVEINQHIYGYIKEHLKSDYEIMCEAVKNANVINDILPYLGNSDAAIHTLARYNPCLLYLQKYTIMTGAEFNSLFKMDFYTYDIRRVPMYFGVKGLHKITIPDDSTITFVSACHMHITKN